MNNLYKLTLLFISIISVQIALSQVLNKEHIANYFDAETYMSENNAEEALKILKKIEKDYPNNVNIQYKIGYAYLNSHSNQIYALDYLKRAAKNVSVEYNYNKSQNETTAPVETFYYLGISERMHYKLDESLQSFDTLKKIINTNFSKPTDKDLNVKIAHLKEMLEQEIKTTNYAIEAVKTPADIRIKNMGSIINSEYADHSPLINKNGDKFYFSSKRPKINEEQINQDEDIFYSEKDENQEWTEPLRLNKIINDEEKNEAIIGFTNDEKDIIFFRCGYDNTGDVLISKILGKNSFGVPVIFRKDLDSKSRETHLSLTRDLKQAYFTSNRKDGKGGRDLYVSRLLPDGKWSNPILLPDNINTVYDEESPFIHPDGVTLYFSSKGHNSIGGYDIFRTKIKEDGSFTDPENLGYPLNTTNDDVSFITNEDASIAYYATNRPDGFGDLDIYQISFLNTLNSQMVYEGQVYNNLNEKLENVNIKVIKKATNELVGIYNTDKNGEYSLVLENGNDYNINYFASGYYNKNIKKTPKEEEFVNYKKHFFPIKTETAVLNPYPHTDTIYFYENKSDLITETTKTLNKTYKLLNEQVNTNKVKTIINITSYGRDKNIDKQRYEIIKNFFAEKNINSSDIYLDNNYPNNEERQIYEIIILEIQIEEIVQPQENIYVANILFAFDKYSIKDCYYNNLNVLANYLNENTTVKIEIDGHCDYKGSDEYNVTLSYNRAKAIKDYLVSKGNNQENIITAKFGKTQPYTEDKDANGKDNPEGRRLNRRVEFKVLTQTTVQKLIITDYDIEKGKAMPKQINSTNVVPTSELNKLSDKDKKTDEQEKQKLLQKLNTKNQKNKNNYEGADLSQKFTIQIIALQTEKPLSFFDNIADVKVSKSLKDDLYRYYVGEFDSREDAKEAAKEIKKLGYEPFVRNLEFLQD